ncbi:hypothetical protein FDK12_14400 [Arthrobacter sp. NamB2]|uniref:hypothetical protein n=1 Tax=Arthrobacter sp. NamB2 TaxID=2576035 RepID=UPI0010C9885D|nr:hypothetical protein [Arthrobacter sp. NamB2]TKV26144.1 hypothetical protein FDK12_14400 [Arthrobacter sp. NamB2]
MNSIFSNGGDASDSGSVPGGDGSAGWAFSDEEAARDAGLIPPDPSTHAAAAGFDTDEIVTGSSDEPADDPDAPSKRGYGGPGSDAGQGDRSTGRDGEEQIGAERRDEDPEAVVEESGDQAVDMDQYPAQPDIGRASDGADTTGYQNDADPPRA